ncbi:hypothetical protein Scep_021236 [Stephania cephalantha]|uniref:Uncharacterized protein n=1 Tax=Stephania cephalantha TaxID=152367 RepID=A0AAP0F5R3_9MAGN
MIYMGERDRERDQARGSLRTTRKFDLWHVSSGSFVGSTRRNAYVRILNEDTENV